MKITSRSLKTINHRKNFVSIFHPFFSALIFQDRKFSTDRSIRRENTRNADNMTKGFRTALRTTRKLCDSLPSRQDFPIPFPIDEFPLSRSVSIGFFRFSGRCVRPSVTTPPKVYNPGTGRASRDSNTGTLGWIRISSILNA